MASNWYRTGEVLKQTFRLAAKDKDLYWPPILNLLVNFGLLVLLIVSFLVYGLSPFGVLLLVLLFFGSFLTTAIFGAALSWMTLEVVRGEDTHLGSGLRRAFSRFSSLAAYAFVALLIQLLVSQLRNNRNGSFLVMLVKRFFAGVIDEAWDIAGNFMLPAIALTDHGFKGAVKELPVLLKHLPQALVGGFAFDLVLGWVILLDIAVAALFGWLLAAISPLGGLLAGIALAFVLIIATVVFHGFVKSVYFTNLYLDLHPEMKKGKKA